MKTLLGYAILLFSLAVVFLRNPRWAVYGMVMCDNIRPGDEHIEFGMESVRFSITYYAVALGFLLVFYKRYRMTSDRFHWAIFFLFLSVVNSALHAPCFGPAFVQIDNYYKMLLQYYLICAFIRDEKQIRELFWAIGLSMFVVSLAFFYNKFYLGRTNWEGATGDRNEMAMAGVMAFPMMFMLGLTAKDRMVKLFAWGTLPFLALMILFSLSRGGMLGLGAVGGYLLYRLHHKRWLIVVGVFTAIVGLLNMPSEVAARFMTIGSASRRDASAIGRLNAWGAARAMARDRPLWGVGTGNFLVYFRRYAPDPDDVHVAHSSLYQLMGEQGFVGVFIWGYLVLMTWLVVTWCEWRIVRLERGKWSHTRYYLVMVKGSWVGYVLCGAFLSQEDMDFFYHIVAITSRFTVFIADREAIVRAERAARIAAEKEFNRKELVLPPVGGGPSFGGGGSIPAPGWR